MRKLLFLTILGLLSLFQSGLAQVNVSVDWGNQQGTIPSTMSSLNMWYSIDPAVKTNTKYQGYLKSLNLKMVRIHGWEMITQGNPRCWVDFPNQSWNVTAISNSLSGMLPNVGSDAIMNIPGDVSFITTDDQYAAFCAQLVQIVNIQLGYNIKYWEPQNERSDTWSLSKMVTRYNKCAVAMKAVDPTIKIGGPACNQPYWSDLYNFLSQTKSNIDFVTYHHYGGGDGTISDTDIYNNAVSVGNAGGDVRNQMNSAGIPASTPLYLGETNIVWSYDLDPNGKMATNVGAVYDAIVLQTAVVKGAVQSVQYWNDRDGAYGKLDASDNPRPAFYNLQVASNNMYGNWFNSTTTDNTKVLSLAVDNNGTKAIMLINRSTTDQTVNLNFTGWSTNSNYTRYEIKTSYSTISESWSGSSKSITIPSESVTYLVFSGATVPVTAVTVSPAAASVNVGATTALTATIAPSTATNKNVSWSSDNTTVATVSSSGVVTGVTVGSATITATTQDQSKTAFCTITVNAGSLKAINCGAGAAGSFIADSYYSGGTASAFTYSIDVSATNAAPAAVYQSERWGNMTYTITGLTANASYTVRLHFAEIYFNSAGARKFNVKIAGTQVLTNYDVWVAAGNMANKAVVRDFTAAANGSGNIVIQFINVTDNAKISGIEILTGATVPVTGVSLNNTSATIAINTTKQLTATIAPATATNKNVSWTSSNIAIATVSSSGLVTAKAPGAATITVNTQDGNKKAYCAITVIPVLVTGLTVSPAAAAINVGATTTLAATVLPANATNKTVSWSCNNTLVATVSSGGVVTGVAVGSANITATTQDGNKTASCAITVNSSPAYNIYTDLGTQNFANDGGTVVSYEMNPSTITTGAPEGSNFLRLSVTGDYAKQEFVYGSAANKSTWSSANIQFSVKTTQDFTFFMEDFAGSRIDVNLSNYITKSGNWESVSIPVSAFSGVNLGQLKGLGFYNLWNATKTLDFDNLRITGGSVARIASVDLIQSTPLANTDEAVLEKIEVYPNPGNGIINLQLGNHKGVLIDVYDAAGKELFSDKTSMSSISINLTGHHGMVLVKLRVNNHVITKKIIIN